MVKGFSKDGLISMEVKGDRVTVYAEMCLMMQAFLNATATNPTEFRMNKRVVIELIQSLEYESED